MAKVHKDVRIEADDKTIEKLVYLVEKLKKAVPAMKCEYVLTGKRTKDKDGCSVTCALSF